MSEIEDFMKTLSDKKEIERLAEIGVTLSSRLNKMQAKKINAPQ
jgi:hypothetical protein